MKKFGKVLLGFVLLLFGVYIVMAIRTKPVTGHPFFSHKGIDVIAHRGGWGMWPENTVFAFQKAVDLGVDMLEMDIRSTRDGVLVVIHDGKVDRTTDGTGAVQDFALSELKVLDAGYRWMDDDGQTFPYRGQGLRIPTLMEVFETIPNVRMNIEIKQTEPDITVPFCELIRKYGMENRVLVACFDSKTLKKFRTLCPEVATSAGLSEGLTFYVLSRLHLSAAYRPDAETFQVPLRLGSLNGIHPAFLSAVQAQNMVLQVWTINDEPTMKMLIDLGVDGVITAYPDRLLNVLGR